MRVHYLQLCVRLMRAALCVLHVAGCPHRSVLLVVNGLGPAVLKAGMQPWDIALEYTACCMRRGRSKMHTMYGMAWYQECLRHRRKRVLWDADSPCHASVSACLSCCALSVQCAVHLQYMATACHVAFSLCQVLVVAGIQGVDFAGQMVAYASDTVDCLMCCC